LKQVTVAFFLGFLSFCISHYSQYFIISNITGFVCESLNLEMIFEMADVAVNISGSE